MTGASPSDDDALSAGGFSSWMVGIQRALRGEQGSDVPCGECTACCTSSQFVQIGPDETETLSHIPPELVFPAPGLPRGHVVLGYDERGHCPMLVDNTCTIYEHRPRTCRTYDCRVFPAAGLRIDDPEQVLIARRAERWRFVYPTPADRDHHTAVRAAATFLRDNAGALRHDAVATTTTQLAVAAIELHDVFLRHDDDTNVTTVLDPDPEAVRVELTRRNGIR